MFKIGDRVRCIMPVGALECGKVYTVVVVVEEDYLTVRGGYGEALPFMYAWRFVKVSTFK